MLIEKKKKNKTIKKIFTLLCLYNLNNKLIVNLILNIRLVKKR